jgi:hypothetical protein
MTTDNGGKARFFDRGVIVLSIDTEQIWGYLDVKDEAGFLSRFPHSVSVHDRLLNSLCAANISATWTVVGGLSLQGSSGPEDPRFSGSPKSWTARIKAGDEESAPLWYRRSFVARLHQATPAQDVGIHGGMSHLIWGDSRTSSEIARRELSSGIHALQEIGIEPRAFVFPRNKVTHLDVLARHGVRCYRGRAPVWSERVGLRHGTAGRVLRLLEEAGKLAPPTVWPEEVLPGLWNVPASLNLYAMKPAATRVAPLGTRLKRVRLGIEAAARQRRIFHFWFHPENLAEASWSYPTFETILEELVRRRDAGDVEILNMNQVVDRVTEKRIEPRDSNGRNRVWSSPIEVGSSAARVREKAPPGQMLARFMDLRGRRVLETAGALWYSMDGHLYRSLPLQRTFEPNPEELDEMLRFTRGLGANFPSQIQPGLPNGLYICRHKDYDFGSVSRSFRCKLRRGLKQCEIRRVEPAILDQAIQLNLDTMERQGRFDPEFGDPVRWKHFVAAVRQVPTMAVWAAFVNGRLAAYRITHREDGWLFVLYHMSRTEDLKFCPNHALDFELTREITRDRDLEAVSLGTMGLVSKPGLHDYKLRLGYEVIPRNWAFRLHPALSRILASETLVKMANLAARIRPNDRLKQVAVVLEGARLSRLGSSVLDRASLPAEALLSRERRTMP